MTVKKELAKPLVAIHKPFLPRNTKQKMIHRSPEFPYESGTGVQ